MKIFDDRFADVPLNQFYENPYYGEVELGGHENYVDVALWSLTAKSHVRGELTAFEMAQGSLIPYFYGAHKARLPSNGHADT